MAMLSDGAVTGRVSSAERLSLDQAQGSGRRDDIQGLRALAVLAVVAFHAIDFIPGGFVGVDIFFVISGYVITQMLAREWSRHGRIRLGNFFIRRIKRLTPALALVIAFTILGSSLLLSPLGAQQLTAQTGIGALLLVANIVIARTTGDYFDPAAETNPLLHTWSLSVEEQFYLVFPIVLALSWGWSGAIKSQSRERLPLIVVASLGTGSLALALFGGLYGPVPQIPETLVGFYGPATRVWEFAAGAVLALVSSRLQPRSTAQSTSLALVGLVSVAASLVVIHEDTPFPGPWTLLPVAGTVLLLIAGAWPDNFVSRTLSLPGMIRVGDLSYSLYLWHWPFIVFASLLWPGAFSGAAAAVLSIVPAWLSYRFVEEPFRASRLRGPRLAGVVAAMLLIPLLLGSGVLIAAENGYWNASVKRYQAAIMTPHLSAQSDCTSEAWTRRSECTWNRNGNGPPIYLVGDSNADHLSEAVIGAGFRADRPVRVTSQTGCTYVDVVLEHRDPVLVNRCNSYFREMQEYLIGAPNGQVIIANAYLWWRVESEVEIGFRNGQPSKDPEARLDMLSEALRATVRALENAGHEVVIVQVIPHWGDNAKALSWASCSVIDMSLDSCAQNLQVSETAKWQGAIRQTVDVAAHSTNARILDLTPYLCPGGWCESESADGLIRYRDGTHITAAQSEALVPVMTSILGQR